MMKTEKDTLHIPLKEKIKSVPEIFGIRLNEEPDYEVLKKDGPFEVRRYPAQLLAEVTVNTQNFDEFRQPAFETLANYIFGGNKNHENMAMTSPVLQQKTVEGSWTMSFILPSEFNLQNVAQPLDEDVKLREVTGYEAAVVRYSGNNTIERIREHEVKLAMWVKSQPDLQMAGEFFSAQYDQPMAISFLKTNEIQVKVNRFS